MHIHRAGLISPEEDQTIYLVQDTLQRQVSSVPCLILTYTENLDMMIAIASKKALPLSFLLIAVKT